MFVIPIYSDSLKDQERNYKKIYTVDRTLVMRNSLVWDGSYSRALESMVFIHLYQRWKRVHYYLTREKRQEVDFIVVDSAGHPSMTVQVSMDITQQETMKRELEPIITTAKYFGIRENIIVTYNQEMSFLEEGISVKAVSAWKCLLN